MTGDADRNATMNALRRALPYIRLYKDKTFVVKLGGGPCADKAALANLAEQIGVLRAFGVKVVVVHGGGPQTTDLSQRLGLKTTFVEGRRVTDEATLDVAVMTISGAVNTAILSACRAAGVPAVGVSGVDAGLIRARIRPARVKGEGANRVVVDYGLVGDVVAVDGALLRTLLSAGLTPVMSPISADDAGLTLNLNADVVAAAVARELGAEKLVFLTDLAGLMEDKNDPSTLVSYTDVRGLNALLERGVVDAGMLPKLNAVKEALYGGVRRIHLVGAHVPDALLAEIFTNEGAGTLIVADMNDLMPAELGEPSHVERILKAGAPAPSAPRETAAADAAGGAR
jgi:acetylglutamate kinase